MTREQRQKYKPDSHWNGRSLENYKAIHGGTAKSKGVSADLAAATTLTKARKVVFGYKKGNAK